jgi:hypothetical protein
MSIEYIRKYYHVPAKRGGIVREKRNRANIGRITRSHHSHLVVQLRTDREGFRRYYHPEDLEYCVNGQWPEEHS